MKNEEKIKSEILGIDLGRCSICCRSIQVLKLNHPGVIPDLRCTQCQAVQTMVPDEPLQEIYKIIKQLVKWKKYKGICKDEEIEPEFASIRVEHPSPYITPDLSSEENLPLGLTLIVNLESAIKEITSKIDEFDAKKEKFNKQKEKLIKQLNHYQATKARNDFEEKTEKIEREGYPLGSTLNDLAKESEDPQSVLDDAKKGVREVLENTDQYLPFMNKRGQKFKIVPYKEGEPITEGNHFSFEFVNDEAKKETIEDEKNNNSAHDEKESEKNIEKFLRPPESTPSSDRLNWLEPREMLLNHKITNKYTEFLEREFLCRDGIKSSFPCMMISDITNFDRCLKIAIDKNNTLILNWENTGERQGDLVTIRNCVTWQNFLDMESQMRIFFGPDKSYQFLLRNYIKFDLPECDGGG